MVRNPKSKLAYQNCYGIKSLLMEKPKDPSTFLNWLVRMEMIFGMIVYNPSKSKRYRLVHYSDIIEVF